jgi:hypothetical protein
MCKDADEARIGAQETLELIARMCHETNRAYCEAFGDTSQPTWESAPDWQKNSAIQGVLFHMEHPDAKPCDSHNSWLAEKARAGWKYGPVKDAEKKEHPCFVSYHDLPFEQQTKDHLFGAVCDTLLRLYFPNNADITASE